MLQHSSGVTAVFADNNKVNNLYIMMQQMFGNMARYDMFYLNYLATFKKIKKCQHMAVDESKQNRSVFLIPGTVFPRIEAPGLC